jgi:hypothetical protein
MLFSLSGAVAVALHAAVGCGYGRYTAIRTITLALFRECLFPSVGRPLNNVQ